MGLLSHGYYAKTPGPWCKILLRFHQDPTDPAYEVRNLRSIHAAERLRDRLTQLEWLDRTPDAHDHTGTMSAMDACRHRALDMLTTDEARRAFDLSLEPRHVNERYGMHRYGQRALLARRLVEAGASFVTMVTEKPSHVIPRPHRPPDADLAVWRADRGIVEMGRP